MGQMEDVVVLAPAGTDEFLTFRLGEEEYGIDILKVREIRRYDAVTRVASAPAFIKGVINLRGTIVPIVDLRIMLGIGKAEYDEFTVVVVVDIAGRMIGVVVDTVSDVLALSKDMIHPATKIRESLSAEYLSGVGSYDGRTIVLVDIEKLLA